MGEFHSQGRAVRRYCLTWHRRGSNDSFQHFVSAVTPMQAAAQSRKEIRLALAGNSALWALDGHITNSTGNQETYSCPADDEQTGYGLLCCWLAVAILLLGTLLARTSHHNPRPVPRLVEQRATISDRYLTASVTPPHTEKKDPVEFWLSGVVFSASTVDVLASRRAKFVAREFSAGDRVISGEVIGDYGSDLASLTTQCSSQDSSTAGPCESLRAEQFDEEQPGDSNEVSAPITGILVSVLPATDGEVSKGTVLFRIAEESSLRVRIPSRVGQPLDQDCEVWKAGSFVTFGEFVRNTRTQTDQEQLRLLDQFAAVTPGMTVDVLCRSGNGSGLSSFSQP